MATTATSVSAGLVWIEVTYPNGAISSIKISGVSAIDRERNVVNVYHSGNYHTLRFDTEAEAISAFSTIKNAL